MNSKNIPDSFRARPETDPAPAASASAISARSLAIGLVLAFATGVVGPVIGFLVQGSTSSFFASPIAVCILLLLVTVVNVSLRLVRPEWVFRKGELLVMFIMTSLANATHTVTSYWLPTVANPLYYSESDWQLLNPHIRSWLIPSDRATAVAFFEGTARDTGIDWSIWLGPLLGWLPMFLALPVAMLCLMVMVRRRWVEQERLTYPVMQLPLAMVQEGEGASKLSPFFHSKIMWLGAAVPAAVGIINGLHSYFPGVSVISLGFGMPLFTASILSFATLGFFFLLPREVILGLWLFPILSNLQQDLYLHIGWGAESDPVIGIWSHGPHGMVHQGMGAMIVLVLGILWVGRKQLVQVFSKALTGAANVDDSDEILSYRGAVGGYLGATAVLFFWLWAMAIPPLGALIFLFFAFVVYLAITRIVAEGGATTHWSRQKRRYRRWARQSSGRPASSASHSRGCSAMTC